MSSNQCHQNHGFVSVIDCERTLPQNCAVQMQIADCVCIADRARWTGLHSFGPLAIAIVGALLIAIIVIFVIGINRCRSSVSAAVNRHQSNLEDKTTHSLTKSNSYKSSPSGKNGRFPVIASTHL
jgi:hypothetical protein